MNTSETVAVGHEGFASSNEASLEDLGEIRRDRINNPKYVRKAVFIYGPFVGALGVLSGYALYFKLEPIVHGDEGVLPIVVELIIAAVMVAILEWVTEIIEKGLGHSLPYRRTTITAIFAFVLFELFVLAAHSLAGVQSEEARRALDGVWVGDWRELVGLAFFWVIIGGGLTAAIASAIFGGPIALTLRGLIGASAGAAAALLVSFYMLLARAFMVAKLIVLEHPKWHLLLGRNHVTTAVGWAMDRFIDARPLGPRIPFGYLLLGLVAIICVFWSWKKDNWTPVTLVFFRRRCVTCTTGFGQRLHQGTGFRFPNVEYPRRTARCLSAVATTSLCGATSAPCCGCTRRWLFGVDNSRNLRSNITSDVHPGWGAHRNQLSRPHKEKGLAVLAARSFFPCDSCVRCHTVHSEGAKFSWRFRRA